MYPELTLSPISTKFCGCRLHHRGIDLIAADNPASFIDNTPTAKLVRQVLGAISEFDKAIRSQSCVVLASASAKIRTCEEGGLREVLRPSCFHWYAAVLLLR